MIDQATIDTRAAMAADLRRAAGVITSGGLAKGNYEKKGGHCTIGALRVVSSTGEYDEYGDRLFDKERVYGEMALVAGLLGAPEGDMHFDEANGGPGFTTITEWNDEEDRSTAEVVTLLEQAAEKLEAEL